MKYFFTECYALKKLYIFRRKYFIYNTINTYNIYVQTSVEDNSATIINVTSLHEDKRNCKLVESVRKTAERFYI